MAYSSWASDLARARSDAECEGYIGDLTVLRMHMVHLRSDDTDRSIVTMHFNDSCIRTLANTNARRRPGSVLRAEDIMVLVLISTDLAQQPSLGL